MRWGILGAANFARKSMAPAIHMARGAEFYGLATSSAEKAAPFLDFNPSLKVYPDYDALLADPLIEAVYIPLPNHLHVTWALRALDAGKHVLVEKPLGLRESDFDAVIAKRDATGLFAAEAFMPVHHPQFIRARDLVNEGAIGTLRHAEAVFTYNNESAAENIRNQPETGGGGIPDIGVYVMGGVRFITGQEPVTIDHARLEWENGVDIKAQMTATFPSFTYSGLVSMRLFPRQEITLQGSHGILRLRCPFNPGIHDLGELTVETAGGKTVHERFPLDNHYVNQVENFVNTVRSGAAYPAPLEFSRGTQRMIDMVYAKAGQG